ncbi:MAG: deoxyribodipyrimidine photo-lyase [Caldisericia bacterium]
MIDDKYLKERIIKHKDREIYEGDYIIYWMNREQRVNDNLCIYYGLFLSKKYNKKFGILFNIFPSFLDASLRQFDFMIKGLIEIEESLNELGIPFFVLSGSTKENILNFIKEKRVSLLITDSFPLKIIKEIKKYLKEKIDIPFYEIDAHNIIPPYLISEKQEFSAFTLRKKYEKVLSKYLIEPPKMDGLIKKEKIINKTNWNNIYENLKVDKSIKPTLFFKPGEKEAFNILNDFIKNKLNFYIRNKNNPNIEGLSNLSPYLHFGMISPLRVTLEVNKSNSIDENKRSFLEELIIRRELSENFLFYNENYDNENGIPNWARKTLEDHLSDEREYVYSLKDFEEGKTHDDLWNACQKEMVITGKMHGYMRMYWAKKILEWSKDYKEAIKIAIYLNDKYELDGRDPNGYTGILWSIGGLHDRPFKERKIFGKIRYMSRNGLEKKFDTKAYIKKISTLERIS